MAQFARVKCKLTRVDHLTKSVSNPCEKKNEKKKRILIISFYKQAYLFSWS